MCNNNFAYFNCNSQCEIIPSSVGFICNDDYLFIDQLSVTISDEDLNIAKGQTVHFVAMATGISTNESNFIYQWRKRRSDSLPEKVSGVSESVFTIPNVTESDEGIYYCIVTNEWDRILESADVELTVYGM